MVLPDSIPSAIFLVTISCFPLRGPVYPTLATEHSIALATMTQSCQISARKCFPSDPLEGTLVCSSFEKGVSWHHLCLDSSCQLKARYAPGNLRLINPWIFLLFTNLDFILLVKQEQAIWLSQESWSPESTEWLKISMHIWGSGKMATERLL